MKVWTNIWLAGTAAVVVAETADEAEELLNEELIRIGLAPTAMSKDFIEIETNYPRCFVLRHGDY